MKFSVEVPNDYPLLPAEDLQALYDELIPVYLEISKITERINAILTAQQAASQNAEAYLLARDGGQPYLSGTRDWEVSEFPIWIKPVQPYELYPVGYLVQHNDKVWRSMENFNSKTPSASGKTWEQVSDEELRPLFLTEQGVILSWRIGGMYNEGDKVTYKDKVYVALMTHMAEEGWSPEEDAVLWKPEGDK